MYVVVKKNLFNYTKVNLEIQLYINSVFIKQLLGMYLKKNK